MGPVLWLQLMVPAATPGGRADLDIGEHVPKDVVLRYVRLRTASSAEAEGPWAGPDIDAVGLIQCAPKRIQS